MLLVLLLLVLFQFSASLFGFCFCFYSNFLVFRALHYAFCLFIQHLLNFQFLARCHNHCLTVLSQWSLFKVFHTHTYTHTLLEWKKEVRIESVKKERKRAFDNNVNNERYLYYFLLLRPGWTQFLVHFDSILFFWREKIVALFLFVLIREREIEKRTICSFSFMTMCACVCVQYVSISFIIISLYCN